MNKVAGGPRDRALRALSEQCQDWPDLKPLMPDTRGLDPRDARLAERIYRESMRRLISLRHLLGTHLRQPFDDLEPRLRAVLLAGACQLLLMDRIPDHAAVDESVHWARRRIRSGAAGLVNAVLRRIAESRGDASPSEPAGESLPRGDGTWLALKDGLLPQDSSERLSVQMGLPLWLVRRRLESLDPARARSLMLHDLAEGPVIIAGVSTAQIDADPRLRPHARPGFAVWDGESGGLAAWLAEHPEARVQDPAAAAAVAATSGFDLSGKVIVDACAGGGTKTAQLAALHPGASIIATDVKPAKFERLSARFKDHPRVRVLPAPQVRVMLGQADLLLLDVPCSNSGVLARRVEARHRLGPEHLRDLVRLQKQIVADFIFLLRPGGRILYSTCSLEDEENGKQAEWIARQHRITLVETGWTDPAGLPGEDASAWNDGGYFCLLHR